MKRLYILLFALLGLIHTGASQNWTWTATNGPFGGSVNDFTILSSGVYLTATAGGVFRSSDSGVTWTRISVGTNQVNITDIEVTAAGIIYLVTANSNFVFSSSDGGLSFTQLASSGLSYSNKKIKVAPTKNYIYVLSNGNQLFRSSDGGASFSLLQLFASTVYDLDVDATVSPTNYVYVSTFSGIQYSNNDGFSFSPPMTGLNTTTVPVYALAIDGSNTLYALASTGPFRSTDHGTDWSSIKGALTDTSFSGITETDASGNLYLLNSITGKIYYNTNPSATTTWSSAATYSTNNNVNSAFFQNTTTWFLGHNYLGLEKSSDGGATWSTLDNGISANNGPKLLIDGTNNRIYYANAGIGFYVSVDAGANWNLISSGTANRQFSGFIQLSDNSLLAYGASGSFRSTDNGATWVTQSSAYPGFITSADGTNLYYASGTSLFKSTNQASTWINQNITGLPAGSINKTAVNAAGDVYLMFYNFISSQYELWKVSASTAIANKVVALPATSITDLKTYGSFVYVLYSNTLYTSANGGAAWTTRTFIGNGRSLWLYDDKNIFVQSSTGVQVSSDGGATWQTKSLVDSNIASISDFAFTTDQHIYVATNYSAVQKTSTIAILPAAPTALTVVSKQSEGVDLMWNDNASNEDTYIVEASIGNNSSYNVVVGNTGSVASPQNKFLLQGLSADSAVLYFFRVRAQNAAGYSNYSNEVSTYSLGNCRSTVPDNRSWTAVTTVDPGSTASGPGPFTGTNVSIIKVSAGSKNGFAVSAYDFGIVPVAIQPAGGIATVTETCGQTYFSSGMGYDVANGNGTWDGTHLVIKWQTDPTYNNLFQGTTTFTLNPSDPVPAVPTLNAYSYNSDQVLLGWGAVPFATQYQILRSTTSGTGYTLLATVNYPTVQYFDNTVTNGTPYYYIIKAKNSTGSSQSSEAPVTPTVTLFTPLQNGVSANYNQAYGLTWADLDNDGDDDYLLESSLSTVTGASASPNVYENTGGGQFIERQIGGLAGLTGQSFSAINASDFNNDGKIDLYFANSSGGSDFVLFNNGNWNFIKLVMIGTARGSGGFASSQTADFDQDGLVDVYIDQFLAPTNSLLFKNAGSNNFTPITTGSILTDAYSSIDASSADYDNDGKQDLLVPTFTYSTGHTRLYRNTGNMTFSAATGTIFDTDLFNTARTSSWGDIDNDGDLDLYIGGRSPSVQDRLYRNDGGGTFTFLSGNAASETGTTSRGTAFGDIDNDGDLDLLSGNTTGANSLFLNDGAGNFTKYTGLEMVNNPTVQTSGIAFSDYDNNGFIDVSLANFGSSLGLPTYIYKNNKTASVSTNWIEFKLVGTASNKAAIGARITVKTLTPVRSQIRDVVSKSGSSSMNSLTQHFGLGTATSISQIIIKWPNGGVQTWDNPPAVTTVNNIITITEDFTGPTFTFAPANSAINVALNSTLQITLNETGSPVGGKNITVHSGSAAGPVVQTLAATSGVLGTNNTYVYSLSSTLTPLSQYFVAIDAGSFSDSFGNTSLIVSPSAWSFTTLDNVAPTVSFTAPALIDKSSIVGQIFSVTATDNISVSNVVMSYRGANGGSYKTLNGTLNAGTGKYDFPLQLAFFDAIGMEYYFTATDGSSNVTTSPASGTFVTKLDNVAPVVSFTPPVSFVKGSITGQVFSVTATDNFSISTVVLSHRKITATAYQTLTGTFNATSGKYDFLLDAAFFDDMGMEYYFTATDGSGNTAVSPASGTDVTKLAFSATTIALGVSAGSAIADYKIISIPLDLATANLANIFVDFGAPDPTAWKLLKYQSSPQTWLSYPNGFSAAARGVGYFILSRAGKNLKFDQASAPQFSQTSLFQLNLVQGFNLIGNPYTMPINWDDSRAGINGVNAVKLFQGGNFVDGNSIDVFSGGFVFANSAVTVPVKLKTSVNGGRGASPAMSSRIEGEEWIVPILMTQEQRQFNFGGVGMSPKASLSYDELDDLAPPSPNGVFEMSFAHPEHFMKKFSRDVVPTTAGYTWTFNAESDLGSPAELKWNNADFSGSSKDIYLFDVGLQRPINMKTESTYSFSPGVSKEFKVYYGKDAVDQMKPHRVFLGQPTPNPASAAVSIPFTLPDVDGNMNVRLEIFDMMGRHTATVVDKILATGFYTATWDASSGNAGNGFYVVRLSVSHGGGQELAATKLIVQK